MITNHLENGINELNGELKDNLIHDIQVTRSRICDVFLCTIAAIAIPALAASLYRITEVGWQPVMGLHLVLAIILWSVFFFRNRIEYNYKAGFIVMIFFFVGLGGMMQFGLVAGGTVFLVAASPIATLFFGLRIGVAAMILTFCGAVLVGALTVSGQLDYEFDLSTYALAPSSWISSIIGWGFTSTALTVSLHVFNKNLINALKISRQHQASLFKYQMSLVKTIEERDYSNRELQKALEEIKTLRGILPICSYCHRIRNDEGAWSEIEDYLSDHSEAKLTHGICPKCMSKARADAGLVGK